MSSWIGLAVATASLFPPRLAGGLAMSAPTDATRLRIRKALVVAGGPEVSLTPGIIALIAFRNMQFAPVYTV